MLFSKEQLLSGIRRAIFVLWFENGNSTRKQYSKCGGHLLVSALRQKRS